MKTFIEKAKVFIKKASLWGFVASFVVGGIYLYGYTAGAATLNYQSPEIKEVQVVKEVQAKSAVMARIAKCESGASHTDKNGQVLINKTQDAGIYQINVPIWGKKASEMNLNLFIEKDNTEFAYWLYDQFGTEPWVHSKKCWNK